MANKPPVCHHCGKPVPRELGGDLTCSADCLQRFAKARQASELQLASAGFAQHTEIPNLWARDGVHISIDQVIREGFEETLARHAEAVQG